jgi:hypothetical protein
MRVFFPKGHETEQTITQNPPRVDNSFADNDGGTC